MKIIVTDTGVSPVKIDENDLVIRRIEKIETCDGCMGCWVKTPGICVKNDDLMRFGEALAMADDLILVSHMTYGSYSPFVKTVLERALPYFVPSFTEKGGKTHYQKRYKNTLRIVAYFYGEDMTKEEKETAEHLIADNAESFGAKVMNVIFLDSAAEVGGGL